MTAFKTHLKRSVPLYLPVTGALAAIVALVAVDLARDFEAWWSPPEKTSEVDSPASPLEVPEGEREGATVLDEETGQEARISYTTFFTLTYKSFEVVTGKRYDKGGKQPDYEYCYAARAARIGSTIVQVSLAQRDRGKAPRYTKISEPEVEPFGVSAGEMMAIARSHCRFTDYEAATEPQSTPEPQIPRRKKGDRDA